MISRETPLRPVPTIVLGFVLLLLAGCMKKSGQAVVIEKEHIAAAEIREASSPATGQSSAFTTPSPDSQTTEAAVTIRELKPDEIVVTAT